MNKLNKIVLGAFVAAALGVGPALAVDSDPVVATVNGKDVHLTDVENARNLLPAELQNAPLKTVYPVLLESLINSRVSADKAQEMGYQESPEYLHRMARISDQILERILLARHIEQKLTDAVIMESYQEIVESAKDKFQVRARHILVKTEDEAKDLIEKLGDGGDFVELAKEHSIGPSKSEGGDLGWFSPEQMVGEFAAAVTALDLGKVSPTPVETQFGWHVILVEERRPVTIRGYQEVREELAEKLSAEIGREYMQELRTKSKIEKKTFEEVVKTLQD